MLCDNCKKRQANVRYSENINGIKKELHLCEECSERLGIVDKMEFRMPSLDFANFFGSFFEDFSHSTDFIPLVSEIKELRCDSCGGTFDNIINTGRYGCANCYDVFEDKMDPILKKLQAANRHTGRLGKISNNNIKFNKEDKQNNTDNKLEKLQADLKLAIKEERYEDAAKIRDMINEEKG